MEPTGDGLRFAHPSWLPSIDYYEPGLKLIRYYVVADGLGEFEQAILRSEVRLKSCPPKIKQEVD
jgi:hypothetical protein